MSLWELAALVDGYNKAQGDGKPEAPTTDEFEAMKRAHGDD